MALRAPRHYAPGDSPADRARRLSARRATYDQSRAASPLWQFYQTKQWKELRNQILRTRPHCVQCGAPSRHLDHIIPIRVDWSRRLDPSNLQPLCHSCHSRKTAVETKELRHG